MKLKFVDKKEFYSVFSHISDEEKDYASDFIDAEYDFGDFEVKYSYFAGCIILRYFSPDAGYHFDAPFSISNSCDEASAFIAISEYCKAEAIAETIVGIEPDSLDLMLRGAEKYSLCEDEDGTLAVRIITECMECEYLPEILYDDVYLGEFADSYADKYEEIIKNANLNCHYSYNVLDDIPNGKGVDFIKNAREEFERSESMTFAATVMKEGENRFVGEGVIYAFDGRGGASVAFRVHPDYHRRGIATKIFRGLLLIAKDIGLKEITAEVKNENTPSLGLLSKFASGEKREDKVIFKFSV